MHVFLIECLACFPGMTCREGKREVNRCIQVGFILSMVTLPQAVLALPLMASCLDPCSNRRNALLRASLSVQSVLRPIAAFARNIPENQGASGKAIHQLFLISEELLVLVL